tara:strand:- start:358 stop:1599 length:1242 start_codon:yes stop_codon:yes gene_type:complete
VNKTQKIELLNELSLKQKCLSDNCREKNILKNPFSAYTCPQIAEKEYEVLFKNNPQLIGLSSDLPKKNSFFTTDYLNIPLLLTRDENNKFHAFVNACRHRGARIESDSRGVKECFTCPYHCWRYSNNGDLLSYPDKKKFGEIETKEINLHEISSEEKYGMLWVNFSKTKSEIIVDDILSGFKDEIDTWRLQDYDYADGFVIRKNCNWKLIMDTFGESYHIPRLHKHTLGHLSIDLSLFEVDSNNSRWVFAKSAIINFNTIINESNWDFFDMASVFYFLFPNIQLGFFKNFIGLFVVTPDIGSISKSTIHVSIYRPKTIPQDCNAIVKNTNIKYKDYFIREETQSNPDCLDSIRYSIQEIFEKEDCLMATRIQESAYTNFFPFQILGHNELLLQHFHNTIRRHLELPPLDSYKH